MTDDNEAIVRGWCESLAATAFAQLIQPNGTPYLERYFLAGWNPTRPRKGPAVYLHHFVASDPADQVHSHPWIWSASVILVGGYREERCIGDARTVREYRPGDVNVLLPADRHRIDLLGADCWTLFLAGDFRQPWAFFPSC